MILADQIRKYVIEKCIIPARIRNHKYVIVRAIEVHQELNLDNRMPAVCDAINAKKFIEEEKIQLVSKFGKKHDWKSEWVFMV